jgi:IS1 family transposase
VPSSTIAASSASAPAGWSWTNCGFVGKKQKRTRAHETQKGDQYVALASTSRAIVTYLTGKRDGSTTDDFIQDLRQRVLGAPEISTDGFKPYQQSIRECLPQQCARRDRKDGSGSRPSPERRAPLLAG